MNNIFMVLESTGTNTERNAILDIAAVKFDPITGAFDKNFFHHPVKMPHNRYWDESTRQYWRGLRDEYEELAVNGLPFDVVWANFMQWVQPVDNLILWGRPSRFVFGFIDSYCKDLNQVNPFAHYNCVDMTSFVKGLHFPEPPPTMESPGQGSFKNALVRALTNIKILGDQIGA